MEFWRSIIADFWVSFPVLCVFGTSVAVDVILGTMAGWALHVASSATSRAGMMRKFAMAAVTLGFMVADGIFPTVPLTLPIVGKVQVTIAMGVSAFWILTELQSIVEKLAILGVPMPKGIRKRLIQVQKAAFDMDKKDK